MRNKFKKRKTTARPTRYVGHGDPYGGDRRGGPAAAAAHRDPALLATAPARTSTEKALVEEQRFSVSVYRPSMMSDRSSRFTPMSFELPRR